MLTFRSIYYLGQANHATVITALAEGACRWGAFDSRGFFRLGVFVLFVLNLAVFLAFSLKIKVVCGRQFFRRSAP
ncbi:hypothetical protein [Paraburkholderia sp.]|uniref:hypothetical protein n=1 Tax=Paraburkholderia sp. TaxID=1926495 RepID=UPI003C7AAD8F